MWAWLSRVWCCWRAGRDIVQPATVIGWQGARHAGESRAASSTSRRGHRQSADAGRLPRQRSRLETNDAIRTALQTSRSVGPDHRASRVLVCRQEMTGTDGAYADRYAIGDVVRYTRGSKTHFLEPREYATVVATNRDANALTVRRVSGTQVAYDLRSKQGVTVYQERMLAIGDRVPFTAPSWELGPRIVSWAPCGR